MRQREEGVTRIETLVALIFKKLIYGQGEMKGEKRRRRRTTTYVKRKPETQLVSGISYRA